MDSTICPFHQTDANCIKVKCELWDVKMSQCSIVSIAANLAKLESTLSYVIDKLVYKN